VKTLSIHIYGKVQGVWFRVSTKRIADELGVKGFVENKSDGSVHILAQGSKKNIQAFTEWCTQGPPLARVDSLDVQEVEWNAVTGFTIKRRR